MDKTAALLAGAALGVGLTGYDFSAPFPSRRDWSHITHTYSKKPLTKRQKRRLRGKVKAQRKYQCKMM